MARPTKSRRRVLRRRGEEGASLVEFAIVVPVFALLLFAMIDFGLVFQSYIGLRNGVNAGARDASVSQIDSSCQSATNPMVCTVQNRIGSLLGVQPSSLQVAICFPGGNSSVGGAVRVTAQATMRSTTGLTSPFLTGRSMSSTSQIRLEQAPTYTGTVSC
jgi:Flp pilus assembly protein TadG